MPEALGDRPAVVDDVFGEGGAGGGVTGAAVGAFLDRSRPLCCCCCSGFGCSVFKGTSLSGALFKELNVDHSGSFGSSN